MTGSGLHSIIDKVIPHHHSRSNSTESSRATSPTGARTPLSAATSRKSVDSKQSGAHEVVLGCVPEPLSALMGIAREGG